MKFELNQKATIHNTDDERLIITGIASDTNKDRYDEYVTPETLKSLCEQAQTLNLHYNHKLDTVLGKITDATIKNNQLHIQAEILPEYAKGLREKLEFGIHYGLSIAGLATKSNDGSLTSYDLVEISLTEEPANPSTYATVQISDKKTIGSDCLGGLCYLINKETKNMTENNNNGDESAPKNITEDDLDNALNELKEEMLQTLRDEFKEDMLQTIREDFKDEIIKDVLSEIKTDDDEGNSSEEVKVEDKVEKSLKDLSAKIEERFTDFEEKHFKKLDETRNPETYMTNTKNMGNKRESNKKTIREISEQYGGL